MGAKPSSAVQQSAYLEALDQYIDYDEHGKLRKCLLDEKGNRLRDKDGNLKTLRHKFAVYCDDIVAGAGTLEELFELFDALICCCAKAGIQMKAAKVKFEGNIAQLHDHTQRNYAKRCKFMHYSKLENTYGCAFSEGISGM